jgi:hypothetical protein
MITQINDSQGRQIVLKSAWATICIAAANAFKTTRPKSFRGHRGSVL